MTGKRFKHQAVATPGGRSLEQFIIKDDIIQILQPGMYVDKKDWTWVH